MDETGGGEAKDVESAARHTQTHELIAVILLSLVAVLTAWCGFESNKWGGDSSVAFSEASAARIEAADYDFVTLPNDRERLLEDILSRAEAA